MLEVILDELKRIAKSRLFPITVLFGLLFLVLVQRIFTIQIVDGEKYKESTEADNIKKIEKKATRGILYDRNGVKLAYNELSYSLQIEDNNELKTEQEKNEMIYKMIHIVEGLGGNITYDFPMKYNKKGNIMFAVEGNSLTRFKVNVYSAIKASELKSEQAEANAGQVYDFLIDKFKVEGYTKEDTYKIVSIRYVLFMNRYIKKRDDYVPITLSTNLSEKIVATLKENRAELPGVTVAEETNRVYKDSLYFAPILGYTGTISSEALQENTENGDKYYSMTDQVGKTGLEQTLEEQLRGKKGTQTVLKNNSGNIVQVIDSKEPVAGNNVYLTLDAELQKASYIMLEKELAAILLERIWNSKSYGSKGKSSDDIMIPVYDVYFALINNNVIDIEHFTADDATELEKSVYSKYVTAQKNATVFLKTKLAFHNNWEVNKYENSTNSYMKQIYKCLKEEGVIRTDKIDTEDETYKKYADGKLALNKFLIYALENQWIDTSMLDIGEKYFTTEELYNKLLSYTFDLLKEDEDFKKLVYYNMIDNSTLSGRDVCLLLFEQNVLKKDESSENALRNGTLGAYSFIRSKIKSLEITPGQLALEPCSGSVVITDPNSGDTLACVTYPSYDNNKLANTVDSKYFSKLYSDKSSPFINRATTQLIAPGSTFKTFSSIVALSEGVIDTGTRIRDKYEFTSVSKPWPHCWTRNSHGNINVSDAIGVSCNYFYYQCGYNLSLDSNRKYAEKIGLNKLQKYAKEFGLDAKSGVELTEFAPHLSDGDAVRSMIGQGTNAFAPIQLSRWVTTIANQGTVYNLTLLDRITNCKGKKIKDYKAEVYKELNVPSSYWAAVKLGMNKVVNGPSSSVKDYFKSIDKTIAGKTGTSQISTNVPNNGLFISYAPYEKPEITATVVIPNGYSSGNAAKTASKIYEYYFAKTKKEKAKILKGDFSQSKGNSHSQTD